MPRNALVTAVIVCLLLALAGGGILGWMYMSRDRAAVASYTVQVAEGIDFSKLVEKESELMKSDEVLKPVVEQLDLLKRWNLKTEDEALARMRSKLKVKPDSMANRVKVIYRDRNQQRALDVLEAINRKFAEVRQAAAARQEMPPVIAVPAPQP